MDGRLLHALVAHVDSVFSGPNGDYPAVLESLGGVTPVQAAWKPTPLGNSIWQIVDHLTGSKTWEIDMLEKGQAASPSWAEPELSEQAWDACLGRLKAEHLRLKSTLEAIPEEDLLKIPAPDLNQTLLELILSITAHEAHHGGQIAYLKGLQSPPSR
jgi:uncharacterized damage-inducible protein DinB